MPVQSPPEQKTDVAPTAGAAQPSLIDKIPTKLVMLLASPYLAGKTAEDALRRAHELYGKDGFSSTIDILGEDADADEDCDASVANYTRLIDLVAASPLESTKQEQITISFKPSMFSTLSPASPSPGRGRALERAGQRIESIVSHARQKGINVTLEAEDARWTDYHLDTYFSLIGAGYANLGTVLQSRLFRTKSDLARFDDRCRVRMVIGIYNESADIAFTRKTKMKELAVEYSRELLSRGTYVELATHDTDCLRDFFLKAVLPLEVSANRFETQYLLGVPRRQVQKALVSGQYMRELSQTASHELQSRAEELADSKVIVRMYLPFGSESVAGPYCKRRLKANPNMVAYGIKNLLHLR